MTDPGILEGGSTVGRAQKKLGSTGATLATEEALILKSIQSNKQFNIFKPGACQPQAGTHLIS